jgi:hypothetical protein
MLPAAKVWGNPEQGEKRGTPQEDWGTRSESHRVLAMAFAPPVSHVFEKNLISLASAGSFPAYVVGESS